MLQSSKLKLSAFATPAIIIPQFVTLYAGIALKTRALELSRPRYFSRRQTVQRYIYLQWEPQSQEERCYEGRKEEVAPDGMLRLPDDKTGPKQGLQQVDRAEERLQDGFKPPNSVSDLQHQLAIRREL